MKFTQCFYIVLLSLFSLTAWAQDNTTETSATIEEAAQTEEAKEVVAPSSPNDGRVEKLEVTGSRIKRINVEGPSPVLTLDREYLDRSGYNSVADVLRDSTVTATGVGREDAGGGERGSSGSATTGLRGFGADKILVLLNGKRLPKIGGQNSVDLNLIPFAAIERVDVLKDGASAIYGSDALAGVINFITKKDYDGATAMYRLSVPENAGGRRTDIAATWGQNFSKGNVLAVYQYRSNQELLDRDRPWSKGSGPISSLGSPGSFREVGANQTWEHDPNCPPGRILGADPNEDQFCGFDYTPYSWTLPAIEQHSAMVTANYDLNESLKLYTNLTYTNRMSRWQFAPAPDIFANDTATGGGNYEIPNSVATGPGWNLPGVGAGNVEVRYRLVDELGTRSNRDGTDSYGGTVGTKGYFGDSWEWDASVTYGASNVFADGFSGYADKDVLLTLMNNGTFRPFDPTGTGSADAARVASAQYIDSSLSLAQFVATGEIGSVAGGLLSSAIGVSATWEDFEERVDAVTQRGALFGGAGTNGSGSRNYQSFFTELGLSWKQLELVLAGRYDQFSDFGSTVNPKFSFRYQPWTEVLFRGSVGTGFKAPTLNELYSSQGYGYPFFKDIVACAASGTAFDCGQQQYRTLTGGNTNLQEETSFSYNLGTVVQPTKDLNFSIDYWYTEINDAIGLDINDLLLAEVALGNAALPTYGVAVNRNGAGKIDEVLAPNLNLAQQLADGLEVTGSWTTRFWGLTVNTTMNHSHFLNYLEEPFPGLGLISKLGESGRPRWRNTSYITVGFLKDHNVRLMARTIAGQFKAEHTADRSDQRRTADYTEFDINYRYNAFWDGQIAVGVRNLFGTDRPLDETAGFTQQLNSGLYDPIGRLYYMSYTQNF